MNRKLFYDYVRANLFSGSLTSSQVNGMETILNEFESRKLTDSRWLAYMLATVHHETAKTMQPITEYGGVKYFDKYDTGDLARRLGNTPEKDGDGYKYRGRGFVQITGHTNYEKFGIADDPDKALEVGTATKIMFDGMINGTFTGRRLSNYFNSSMTDWINARRIINGVDNAKLISGYARLYYNAITGAK